MLTAFAQWLPPVAEESRKCRLTYHPIYYNSIDMIENKTVFVLGAGASCPYGYPSGKDLRKEIISDFCAQYEGYRDARPNQPFFTMAMEAKEFTDKFKKSRTKSIDLFLARNPEFLDIGKKAIALRILAAENVSKFKEHMKNMNLDWYSYLLDKLTEELFKKDDYIRFSENNVSIITFNYDRSLEHFLYESLVNSFNRIPPEKIKEQILKLRIIHVFGQVAGLEWQDDLPDKIEYCFDIKFISIQGLIKNLRIIYEEKENPELEEARKLIREAQHIFFLGFGYAKENLELLNIPKILKKGQNIYGTALGLTPKEIQDIKSIFPDHSPPYASCVHIEDLDCLMLLRQHL